MKYQNIAAKYILPTVLTISTLLGCTPRPAKPVENLDFLGATDYTIRERVFEIKPTYDLVIDGYDAGDMKRQFLAINKHTDLIQNEEVFGYTEMQLLSLGYDMTIYDQEGEIINTIDHNIINPLANFGGFYIKINDPEENLVASLRKDPFSFWTKGKWRNFEVIDPNGEVLASIEYSPLRPDTYKVESIGELDNRTISGIVEILDQIEDQHKRKARRKRRNNSSSSNSD